ncbi:hypothetical protein BC937DRAFT_86157 [Endogone sp. FLAS-F59071]|nr:hypothetical protein BC937DRAFT_86157 [Endogone sp. FLAS-F59071]|eukprot:RUS22864.1 hypothetical protein BC937DRAFT_86157 [Endogone sp. FLAS-F59071]
MEDHRRQYLKVRLFWDDIESTLMGSGLESDKKSGTKRSLDTIEDSQECCGLHSSEDGKGMACNDIFHVHEVELETSKTSVQVDDTISLKWEFDLPMPSWLTKAAKLRSNTPQSEAATKALCWRIIDVSDSAIVSKFSSSEFEELNAVFASALNNGNPKEDLMVVETLPESYLQMLGKLDSNQLKSIGNLVKIEGIRGALREAQKLVGTIKKDQILFEDEVSTSPSPADMKEEDCTHDDVGYIFELLRYTYVCHFTVHCTLMDTRNFDLKFYTPNRCEWISESVASRHNSERDIDMFVKSHIFSCLKGVADQHFGEMVSRASRNRKASALDSPDSVEGYHVDWMFANIMRNTISWFKAIKARAEREQFESGRIQVDNGPPEFATPSKKRISRKVSFVLCLTQLSMCRKCS